ncbi:hypothetical protein K1719_015145 [Acacia pycnantha]|nr:hypothetical protein K1719_015145 [Acacia pycnantha]
MCSWDKRGKIFILTLTNTDEHHLNPTLLNAICSALHRVRSEAFSSSVLITIAREKLFSNNYDLARAKAQAHSFEDRMVSWTPCMLRSVVTDLISLSMPTICVVSGHASATGFMLALSHDNAKIWSLAARHELVVKAAKVKAKRATELGIIDLAHDNTDD